MKYNFLAVLAFFSVLPCVENVNQNYSNLGHNVSKISNVRQRRDYDHGDYHVKCKSSNTGELN